MLIGFNATSTYINGLNYFNIKPRGRSGRKSAYKGRGESEAHSSQMEGTGDKRPIRI